MNWTTAREKLSLKIIPGTRIPTTRNTLRTVISVDGATGFRVRIGQKSRTNVLVPWDMLKICYEVLMSPSGFDTDFFQLKFPRQYYQHDCYVHVVGQLFVKADLAKLAKQNGKYKYLAATSLTQALLDERAADRRREDAKAARIRSS
jgi:hypothetical protein